MSANERGDGTEEGVAGVTARGGMEEALGNNVLGG